MTDHADTQPANAGADPTAGPAELTIPKHRFDEQGAQLRVLREQIQMQQQLLQQVTAQHPGANQDQGPKPEDLGMDPATFQATQALIEREVQRRIRPFEQKASAQIGHLANKNEENEFLIRYANRGIDLAALLPEVREIRQQFARENGGYLPIQNAYEMLAFRKGMFGKQPQAATPAPAQAQPAHVPAPVPGAELTRNQPTPRVPAAGAAPAEQSFEDYEAQLEASMRAQGHFI